MRRCKNMWRVSQRIDWKFQKTWDYTQKARMKFLVVHQVNTETGLALMTSAV